MESYVVHNEFHLQRVNRYEEYLKKNQDEINKSKKQFPNRKEPFFVLYPSFIEMLKVLSHNAVQLYLYCGFNVDYEFGYFVMDRPSICSDLNFDAEEYAAALVELIGNNLVCVKKNNDTDHIFICPYDSDIKYDKTDDFTETTKKYQLWFKHKRKASSLEKEGQFVIIPKSLMKYWNLFKYAGSLKLYVYCCLSAYYTKGFFFKSLDTISKDLGVSKKTITVWFSDLIHSKLVERKQLRFNGPSYTYLVPLIK